MLARPLRAPGSSTVVGTVVVAESVASLERLQREVLLGSLVLAGLLLMAGFFVVRSAVRGALEPVAQMTAAAEAWGPAQAKQWWQRQAL